jgi:hypothetical protein
MYVAKREEKRVEKMKSREGGGDEVKFGSASAKI